MLAQQQYQSTDTKRSKQEIDTKVPRPIHVREEIVPRFRESSNAARFKPKARIFLMLLEGRWQELSSNSIMVLFLNLPSPLR